MLIKKFVYLNYIVFFSTNFFHLLFCREIRQVCMGEDEKVDTAVNETKTNINKAEMQRKMT